MSDLIDRRAAIDELKRISFSHWFEYGEYLSEDTREIEIINSSKALEAIEVLPSAQPEIVRCKDCERWQAQWNFCTRNGCWMFEDDYCSNAERRAAIYE